MTPGASTARSGTGRSSPVGGRTPRVLVLSRAYPNNVTPNLGLWVARPTRRLADDCDVAVVSPVPWCPPVPRLRALRTYTRFRDVAHHEVDEGVPVSHPRMVVGPGLSLYPVEDRAYGLAVRRTVDRLWDQAPFDLIHAHFIFPDGVVAHRLSRRYGVPFVVTEHAPWTSAWMGMPRVRRTAVAAAHAAAAVLPVSGYVRDTITDHAGRGVAARVVPNGFDEDVFTLGDEPRDPDRVLFVGVLNFNKGLDVLFRAIQTLARSRPRVRLVVVGGAFYRNTDQQGDELRRMVDDLGIRERVTFTGMLPPDEVAEHMRSSAVLVLPSKLESFGAVLVEALACGTPVVSTRSGGPEDFVTDAVGRLVPTGDPAALAAGLADVMGRDWSPDDLHDYARERFRWSAVADRVRDVYDRAIAAPRGA